jgi:hypothetical protein
VGYRTALGVMIACEAAAFVWLLLAPRPVRVSLQAGQ